MYTAAKPAKRGFERIKKQSDTVSLDNAQTGAETQQNQAFQENAQMLTPYSDEHLSINGNGTAETKNNLPEKEMCPTCERELSLMANGQMFCEICLYTKTI